MSGNRGRHRVCDYTIQSTGGNQNLTGVAELLLFLTCSITGKWLTDYLRTGADTVMTSQILSLRYLAVRNVG